MHVTRHRSASPTSALPLTLLIAGSLGAAACSDTPEEDPPNVIFITVDTLRADRTTPYGYERDTSPNLARLAAEGALFERAYALSSWTLPSMSMLLSGAIKPLADVTILPHHESISESFQNAGYRTCGVVGNSLLDADYGYDRGLDHFVLSEVNDEFNWTAARILDEGLKWLEETDPASADAARKPYFLWLHPVDPHAPYAPTNENQFPDPIPGDQSRELAAQSLAQQSEARRSAGQTENAATPAIGDADWKKIQRVRGLYDSEILQFDAQLGRLLEVLAARGELEKTIIVVTSDHGEGMWQRAANADESDKAKKGVFPALYSGHGAQLFDEQVRVPLIFRGPGVPSGARVTEPVDLVDVVPSLLALADLPVKRVYGGTPLFEDGSTVTPPNEPVIAVCSRLSSITVDGRWRLHVPRPHRLKKPGVAIELYDLEADPLELNPVMDQGRIDDLTAQLVDWERSHAPDGLRAGDVAVDNQLYIKLHQLGYGGEAEHVKEFVKSLEEERDAELGTEPPKKQ